jgi:hypothetical protein
VILVRATSFTPNPATAADNAFQRDVPEGQSEEATSARALAEMDALAEALRAAGVRVHVFEDDDHTRPDSVFPNNWLSTHSAATSRSTRCTRPTAATSAGPTCWRC